MRKVPWAIGALLAVGYFVVFETLAFIRPEHFASLSNTISGLGRDWPFAIFLMGYFAGVLSAHFFWPWKANPEGGGGG